MTKNQQIIDKIIEGLEKATDYPKPYDKALSILTALEQEFKIIRRNTREQAVTQAILNMKSKGLTAVYLKSIRDRVNSLLPYQIKDQELVAGHPEGTRTHDCWVLHPQRLCEYQWVRPQIVKRPFGAVRVGWPPPADDQAGRYDDES